MAAPLDRDVVFGALTRPQMFAGVTYSYFVINGVVTAELFLITKSFWAIAAGAGDPRDRLRGLPARTAHLRPLADQGQPLPPRAQLPVWRCNSYQP
jgi:type IV secretion system protein VirB3